jgi:hypothetical protein
VIAKVRKEVEGELKKAKSEWKKVAPKIIQKPVKVSKKKKAQ